MPGLAEIRHCHGLVFAEDEATFTPPTQVLLGQVQRANNLVASCEKRRTFLYRTSLIGSGRRWGSTQLP
jgi:hypothetical protein